jgi:ribosomal protein S1
MTEERETPPSEDFATLFAGQETGPALEVGEVVKGRVVQIAAESVFVYVGGRARPGSTGPS